MEDIEYLEEYEDLVLPAINLAAATAASSSVSLSKANTFPQNPKVNDAGDDSSSSLDQDIFNCLFDDNSDDDDDDDEFNDYQKSANKTTLRQKPGSQESSDSLDDKIEELGEKVIQKVEISRQDPQTFNTSNKTANKVTLPTLKPKTCMTKTSGTTIPLNTVQRSQTTFANKAKSIATVRPTVQKQKQQQQHQKNTDLLQRQASSTSSTFIQRNKPSTPTASTSTKTVQLPALARKPLSSGKSTSSPSLVSRKPAALPLPALQSAPVFKKATKRPATIVKPEKIITKDPANDPLELDDLSQIGSDNYSFSDISGETYNSVSDFEDDDSNAEYYSGDEDYYEDDDISSTSQVIDISNDSSGTASNLEDLHDSTPSPVISDDSDIPSSSSGFNLRKAKSNNPYSNPDIIEKVLRKGEKPKLLELLHNHNLLEDSEKNDEEGNIVIDITTSREKLVESFDTPQVTGAKNTLSVVPIQTDNNKAITSKPTNKNPIKHSQKTNKKKRNKKSASNMDSKNDCKDLRSPGATSTDSDLSEVEELLEESYAEAIKREKHVTISNQELGAELEIVGEEEVSAIEENIQKLPKTGIVIDYDDISIKEQVKSNKLVETKTENLKQVDTGQKEQYTNNATEKHQDLNQSTDLLNSETRDKEEIKHNEKDKPSESTDSIQKQSEIKVDNEENLDNKKLLEDFSSPNNRKKKRFRNLITPEPQEGSSDATKSMDDIKDFKGFEEVIRAEVQLAKIETKEKNKAPAETTEKTMDTEQTSASFKSPSKSHQSLKDKAKETKEKSSRDSSKESKEKNSKPSNSKSSHDNSKNRSSSESSKDKSSRESSKDRSRESSKDRSKYSHDKDSTSKHHYHHHHKEHRKSSDSKDSSKSRESSKSRDSKDSKHAKADENDVPKGTNDKKDQSSEVKKDKTTEMKDIKISKEPNKNMKDAIAKTSTSDSKVSKSQDKKIDTMDHKSSSEKIDKKSADSIQKPKEKELEKSLNISVKEHKQNESEGAKKSSSSTSKSNPNSSRDSSKDRKIIAKTQDSAKSAGESKNVGKIQGSTNSNSKLKNVSKSLDFTTSTSETKKPESSKNPKAVSEMKKSSTNLPDTSTISGDLKTPKPNKNPTEVPKSLQDNKNLRKSIESTKLIKKSANDSSLKNTPTKKTAPNSPAISKNINTPLNTLKSSSKIIEGDRKEPQKTFQVSTVDSKKSIKINLVDINKSDLRKTGAGNNSKQISNSGSNTKRPEESNQRVSSSKSSSIPNKDASLIKGTTEKIQNVKPKEKSFDLKKPTNTSKISSLSAQAKVEESKTKDVKTISMCSKKSENPKTECSKYNEEPTKALKQENSKVTTQKPENTKKINDKIPEKTKIESNKPKESEEIDTNAAKKNILQSKTEISEVHKKETSINKIKGDNQQVKKHNLKEGNSKDVCRDNNKEQDKKDSMQNVSKSKIASSKNEQKEKLKKESEKIAKESEKDKSDIGSSKDVIRDQNKEDDKSDSVKNISQSKIEISKNEQREKIKKESEKITKESGKDKSDIGSSKDVIRDQNKEDDKSDSVKNVSQSKIEISKNEQREKLKKESEKITKESGKDKSDIGSSKDVIRDQNKEDDTRDSVKNVSQSKIESSKIEQKEKLKKESETIMKESEKDKSDIGSSKDVYRDQNKEDDNSDSVKNVSQSKIQISKNEQKEKLKKESETIMKESEKDKSDIGSSKDVYRDQNKEVDNSDSVKNVSQSKIQISKNEQKEKLKKESEKITKESGKDKSDIGSSKDVIRDQNNEDDKRDSVKNVSQSKIEISKNEQREKLKKESEKITKESGKDKSDFGSSKDVIRDQNNEDDKRDSVKNVSQSKMEISKNEQREKLKKESETIMKESEKDKSDIGSSKNEYRDQNKEDDKKGSVKNVSQSKIVSSKNEQREKLKEESGKIMKISEKDKSDIGNSKDVYRDQNKEDAKKDSLKNVSQSKIESSKNEQRETLKKESEKITKENEKDKSDIGNSKDVYRDQNKEDDKSDSVKNVSQSKIEISKNEQREKLKKDSEKITKESGKDKSDIGSSKTVIKDQNNEDDKRDSVNNVSQLKIKSSKNEQREKLEEECGKIKKITEKNKSDIGSSKDVYRDQNKEDGKKDSLKNVSQSKIESSKNEQTEKLKEESGKIMKISEKDKSNIENSKDVYRDQNKEDDKKDSLKNVSQSKIESSKNAQIEKLKKESEKITKESDKDKSDIGSSTDVYRDQNKEDDRRDSVKNVSQSKIESSKNEQREKLKKESEKITKESEKDKSGIGGSTDVYRDQNKEDDKRDAVKNVSQSKIESSKNEQRDKLKKESEKTTKESEKGKSDIGSSTDVYRDKNKEDDKDAVKNVSQSKIESSKNIQKEKIKEESEKIGKNPTVQTQLTAKTDKMKEDKKMEKLIPTLKGLAKKRQSNSSPKNIKDTEKSEETTDKDNILPTKSSQSKNKDTSEEVNKKNQTEKNKKETCAETKIKDNSTLQKQLDSSLNINKLRDSVEGAETKDAVLENKKSESIETQQLSESILINTEKIVTKKNIEDKTANKPMTRKISVKHTVESTTDKIVESVEISESCATNVVEDVAVEPRITRSRMEHNKMDDPKTKQVSKEESIKDKKSTEILTEKPDKPENVKQNTEPITTSQSKDSITTDTVENASTSKVKNVEKQSNSSDEKKSIDDNSKIKTKEETHKHTLELSHTESSREENLRRTYSENKRSEPINTRRRTEVETEFGKGKIEISLVEPCEDKKQPDAAIKTRSEDLKEKLHVKSSEETLLPKKESEKDISPVKTRSGDLGKKSEKSETQPKETPVEKEVEKKEHFETIRTRKRGNVKGEEGKDTSNNELSQEISNEIEEENFEPVRTRRRVNQKLEDGKETSIVESSEEKSSAEKETNKEHIKSLKTRRRANLKEEGTETSLIESSPQKSSVAKQEAKADTSTDEKKENQTNQEKYLSQKETSIEPIQPMKSRKLRDLKFEAGKGKSEASQDESCEEHVETKKTRSLKLEAGKVDKITSNEPCVDKSPLQKQSENVEPLKTRRRGDPKEEVSKAEISQIESSNENAQKELEVEHSGTIKTRSRVNTEESFKKKTEGSDDKSSANKGVEEQHIEHIKTRKRGDIKFEPEKSNCETNVLKSSKEQSSVEIYLKNPTEGKPVEPKTKSQGDPLDKTEKDKPTISQNYLKEPAIIEKSTENKKSTDDKVLSNIEDKNVQKIITKSEKGNKEELGKETTYMSPEDSQNQKEEKQFQPIKTRKQTENLKSHKLSTVEDETDLSKVPDITEELKSSVNAVKVNQEKNTVIKTQTFKSSQESLNSANETSASESSITSNNSDNTLQRTLRKRGTESPFPENDNNKKTFKEPLVKSAARFSPKSAKKEKTTTSVLSTGLKRPLRSPAVDTESPSSNKKFKLETSKKTNRFRNLHDDCLKEEELPVVTLQSTSLSNEQDCLQKQQSLLEEQKLNELPKRMSKTLQTKTTKEVKETSQRISEKKDEENVRDNKTLRTHAKLSQKEVLVREEANEQPNKGDSNVNVKKSLQEEEIKSKPDTTENLANAKETSVSPKTNKTKVNTSTNKLGSSVITFSDWLKTKSQNTSAASEENVDVISSTERSTRLTPKTLQSKPIEDKQKFTKEPKKETHRIDQNKEKDSDLKGKQQKESRCIQDQTTMEAKDDDNTTLESNNSSQLLNNSLLKPADIELQNELKHGKTTSSNKKPNVKQNTLSKKSSKQQTSPTKSQSLTTPPKIKKREIDVLMESMSKEMKDGGINELLNTTTHVKRQRINKNRNISGAEQLKSNQTLSAAVVQLPTRNTISGVTLKTDIPKVLDFSENLEILKAATTPTPREMSSRSPTKRRSQQNNVKAQKVSGRRSVINNPDIPATVPNQALQPYHKEFLTKSRKSLNITELPLTTQDFPTTSVEKLRKSLPLMSKESLVTDTNDVEKPPASSKKSVAIVKQKTQETKQTDKPLSNTFKTPNLPGTSATLNQIANARIEKQLYSENKKSSDSHIKIHQTANVSRILKCRNLRIRLNRSLVRKYLQSLNIREKPILPGAQANVENVSDVPARPTEILPIIQNNPETSLRIQSVVNASTLLNTQYPTAVSCTQDLRAEPDLQTNTSTLPCSSTSTISVQTIEQPSYLPTITTGNTSQLAAPSISVVNGNETIELKNEFMDENPMAISNDVILPDTPTLLARAQSITEAAQLALSNSVTPTDIRLLTTDSSSNSYVPSFGVTPTALDNKGTCLYTFLHPARYNRNHSNVLLDYCCPNLDGPMPAIDPTRIHAQLQIPVIEVPASIVLTTKVVTRADLENGSSSIPAIIRKKAEKIRKNMATHHKLAASASSSVTTQSAPPAASIITQHQLAPTVRPALPPTINALTKQLPATTTITAKIRPPTPSQSQMMVSHAQPPPYISTLAPHPISTLPKNTILSVIPRGQASQLSSVQQSTLRSYLRRFDVLLKQLVQPFESLSFVERHRIIETLIATGKFLPKDLEQTLLLMEEYIKQTLLLKKDSFNQPLAQTTSAILSTNNYLTSQPAGASSLPTPQMPQLQPSPNLLASGTVSVASSSHTMQLEQIHNKAVRKVQSRSKNTSSSSHSTGSASGGVLVKQRQVPIYDTDRNIIGYQMQMMTPMSTMPAYTKSTMSPHAGTIMSSSLDSSKITAYNKRPVKRPAQDSPRVFYTTPPLKTSTPKAITNPHVYPTQHATSANTIAQKTQGSILTTVRSGGSSSSASSETITTTTTATVKRVTRSTATGSKIIIVSKSNQSSEETILPDANSSHQHQQTEQPEIKNEKDIEDFLG